MEERPISCKPQGHSFIFSEITGYKLRKPDRIKQARSHPPRERPPSACQHGKSRPQRVARSRVGIVGKRVQNQIGEPMTGQVIFDRQSIGKHEACRIDLARGSLLAQIRLGLMVISEQPQHTAIDAL